MTANWQMAVCLKPPEGGLVVLPEDVATLSHRIEQAAIAFQSGFTGVTSDDAYPELSKVRDMRKRNWHLDREWQIDSSVP